MRTRAWGMRCVNTWVDKWGVRAYVYTGNTLRACIVYVNKVHHVYMRDVYVTWSERMHYGHTAWECVCKNKGTHCQVKTKYYLCRLHVSQPFVQILSMCTLCFPATFQCRIKTAVCGCHTGIDSHQKANHTQKSACQKSSSLPYLEPSTTHTTSWSLEEDITKLTLLLQKPTQANLVDK